MTVLALLCSAYAQDLLPSLADHPSHDDYVRATVDLDLVMAMPPRNSLQMMPGTVGVVKVGTVSKGFVMATSDLGIAHAYLESLVYKSAATVDGINNGSFSLVYVGPLSEATEAAMDTQLAQWDLQDPNDAWRGAADAYGSVDGAKFVVTNHTVPNPAALADPDLMAITPDDTDCLELTGFELRQGGIIVGWLLRERRDYGSDGVQWIDRWFYRATFVSVSNAATTLTVQPTTSLSNPDGVWSLPEFVAEIVLDAPTTDDAAGLDRQQIAIYGFDDLAALVP